MKTPRLQRFCQIFAVSLMASMVGCVTHIAPQEGQNPPPDEKFAAFDRFELQPLQRDPGERLSPAALAKIQQNIDARLRAQIEEWNEKPARGIIRTLVIQPMISDGKFVSGAKRFWFGGMAGSSAIILHATFTEKETGKLIAQPDFFARAAAASGAWTFGAADNIMLVRIANSFAVYVVKNYEHAVGGSVFPTGEQAAVMEPNRVPNGRLVDQPAQVASVVSSAQTTSVPRPEDAQVDSKAEKPIEVGAAMTTEVKIDTAAEPDRETPAAAGTETATGAKSDVPVESKGEMPTEIRANTAVEPKAATLVEPTFGTPIEVKAETPAEVMAETPTAAKLEAPTGVKVETIAVPDNLSDAVIRDAIVRAALYRQWRLMSQKEGEVVLRLIHRKCEANLTLRIVGSEIEIYSDSYEIDKRLMRIKPVQVSPGWIKNLRIGIVAILYPAPPARK
jgi:hypothetical protein